MANIIVAISDGQTAKNIRNLLVRSGYRVTGVASTGAQAIALADDLGGGILVCGVKFADMMFPELRENLPPGFETILLASRKYIEENCGSDVFALAMPLQTERLLEAVGVVSEGLRRRRKRERETPRERTGDESTRIADAKKALMSREGMSEDEAHRYLQRRSMESGRRLAESAEMVLRLYGDPGG